jgi:hypothetical protein
MAPTTRADADLRGGAMQDGGIVSVTRRLRAPAHEIFALLATPSRHLEIDGSEMLRGADRDEPLGCVGDEFLMRRHYEQFGDYVMRNVVVEFDADRRITWEPERHDIVEDEHWHHRWGFELAAAGADATDVTEFYDCTRSPQHAREIIKDGTVWIAAMTRTSSALTSSSPAAGQPEGRRVARAS